MEVPEHGWAIGIDIGTANTRVAVYRNDEVEIIPNADGRRLMPSYVAFTDRVRLIGDAAKSQVGSNPRNTVFGAKRLLGRKFSDPEVQVQSQYLPYRLDEWEGHPSIEVQYRGELKTLSPMEIYAMILARAKENAENYLGSPISGAVISVPTYFNFDQREQVSNAAAIADLNILNMFNAVDSIVTSYTFRFWDDTERLVCFLDLGAGFFNAGLATIEEGVINMLAVASDTYLGGDDFVKRVVSHCVNEIKKAWKLDISVNLRSFQRLRAACEVAMCELSSTSQAQINIESLFEGRDFQTIITRQKFEELCQDLFRSTSWSIGRIFADSMRHKSEVHEIVIVGGCSRIPAIQKLWTEYFGGKPLVRSINAQESEVYGSALYAAIYGDHIPKVDNHLHQMLLLPALPLSVGIQNADGVVLKLVRRNTTCPTKKSEVFTAKGLGIDLGQPCINIYEGEQLMMKENLLIGRLYIDPSDLQIFLKAEEAGLEIIFDIDGRFRLDVTARFVGTRKVLRWEKTSRNDIDKGVLLEEARRYKEDEESEAARIAERNALDSNIASLQDALRNSRETQRVRELIHSVDAIRSWADENGFADLSEFDRQQDELKRIARDLLAETKRVAEYSALESRIEKLQQQLLSSTQTPEIVSLIDSISLISTWLHQSQVVEEWEYQLKRRQLDKISADLTVELSKAKVNKAFANHEGPEDSESIVEEEDANPKSHDLSSTPEPPSLTAQETDSPSQTTERLATIFDDVGLNRLFPKPGWADRHSYSDAEFEEISTYLRNTGHRDWSVVPRIYTVLRLVGQLDLLGSFLEKDITDIWFPFSDNTLPKSLKQPHRSEFLAIQEVVYSKALRFERGSKLDGKSVNRKHAHFSRDEPLPFTVIANLGGGAHGIVDKVMSKLSNQEYARKRFRRSAVVAKKDIKTFFNELKILKMLSHNHCVELVRCLIFKVHGTDFIINWSFGGRSGVTLIPDTSH